MSSEHWLQDKILKNVVDIIYYEAYKFKQYGRTILAGLFSGW